MKEVRKRARESKSSVASDDFEETDGTWLHHGDVSVNYFNEIRREKKNERSAIKMKKVPRAIETPTDTAAASNERREK